MLDAGVLFLICILVFIQHPETSSQHLYAKCVPLKNVTQMFKSSDYNDG